MSCYTSNTNLNAAGGGNTVYLDRHNVRCKLNYGLSMFRLFRGGDKIAYKMRCCTIKSKFHTLLYHPIHLSTRFIYHNLIIYLVILTISARDALLRVLIAQNHHKSS